MRLGSFWGVRLYINPFFVVILALFFVAGVLGKGLLAFGVVLVHETAHILMARRLGVPVSEAELLPFGGVVRMGSELAADPAREIPVALAGPAANLILFGLGLAAKNYGLWHNELGPFFLQCNLLVGIINLLPALPLDGGRVGRALLARRIGLKAATYHMANLGQFFGGLIFLIGAAGIKAGLWGLDIPVTALFLCYAAVRERRSAPYLLAQLVLHKQNELTRTGLLPAVQLAVLTRTSLGLITSRLTPGRFHLITVLDKDWQYRGTVTETMIIDALLQHGAAAPVGDLLPP